MEQRTAEPHGQNASAELTMPFTGPAIVQFAIFCCAVTMVIVLAVALAA